MWLYRGDLENKRARVTIAIEKKFKKKLEIFKGNK